MILKRLIFVGLVGLLTACSSSSNNGGGDTTTGGGTTGSDTTGGGTTGAGTTGGDAVGNQGVWTGDIGYGNGVFVVDGNNNFYGLSSSNGSSYNSSFGNIGGGSSYSGSLADYFHPASGNFSGVAMAPIGESPTSTDLNLNVVTGQTIENSAAGNPFTLVYNPAALSAATPSAIAGSWVGTHSFAAPTENGGVYAEYRMEITFSGNTFTGTTGVYGFGGDEEGSATFLHNVSGTVEGFSTVATTTFTWSDDSSSTTYNGVFYFDPNGTGNLLLNVQAANGGEPVTLNSVLVRR